jgi:hypothetical protein
MLHGEAEERLSGLRMRGCAEQAFPEAVRNHPLYALPAYRTVLEGVLGQEAPARIAGRLGVTRRRVNAQIEDLHRIFACPDPGQVDRIFRTVPEAHWLPGAPLVHRPIRSLRFRPPQTQSSAGVVPALRRFLRLGAQPAVVHVDQYNRVLSGVDVCLAARILGLTVVATLLQVVRSPSADLDDPEYLAACADSEMARSPASAIPAAHAASTARAPGAGAGPQPALIPALAGLLQEGYLSPLAASLLEPLGAAAQYVVLRELGTALLPLLGVREARSLLQSRQDPAFAQAVRALRERLLQRIPAGAGAAPARSARAGTGAAARPRAAGRSAGLSRGGSDSPG